MPEQPDNNNQEKQDLAKQLQDALDEYDRAESQKRAQAGTPNLKDPLDMMIHLMKAMDNGDESSVNSACDDIKRANGGKYPDLG